MTRQQFCLDQKFELITRGRYGVSLTIAKLFVDAGVICMLSSQPETGEMQDLIVDDPNRVVQDDFTTVWTENHPIGRFGQPEERVNCALILAFEETSYFTSAALFSDPSHLIH